MPNGLGNNIPRAFIDRLNSYFAPNDYILVLAALSRPTGQKSMVMRKISTRPNEVSMLQVVPIRCPNSQPSGVRDWSQQPIFFGIPKQSTSIIHARNSSGRRDKKVQTTVHMVCEWPPIL